jgi:phage shock protein C
MSAPGLVRPKQGRLVAGVSLAIANRTGWDVSIVRILTAIAVIFTGVGLVAYIVAWGVIPSGP